MKIKKSRIGIIAIIVFAVIFGMVVYINKEDEKNLVTEVPNIDLAFAVFGDVHSNTESFQEAARDIYTINPAMDALVLNGDSVDQGIESQYDSVKKSINKNKDYLPKTIIKNIGNHEFYDYSQDVDSLEQVQGFIKRYLEFSGEDTVYHDTWIKDYHFISLGSEVDSPDKVNSLSAYISEIQLSWLREKLAENYQKGKPIFVFMHQPLFAKYGNKTYTGVEESDKVKEILSTYPEVILFSSHMHRDLDENSVQLNNTFTMVSTGAIDYTMIPDESSKDGRRKEPYIKGLYIEVNANKVVIKGRDMKEKQWIFTKEINLNIGL